MASSLPSGTVTFLFSDIERNAQLAYSYLLTVRGGPEATSFPHLKEWQTSTNGRHTAGVRWANVELPKHR